MGSPDFDEVPTQCESTAQRLSRTNPHALRRGLQVENELARRQLFGGPPLPIDWSEVLINSEVLNNAAGGGSAE